jgi:hypothetical protein
MDWILRTLFIKMRIGRSFGKWGWVKKSQGLVEWGTWGLFHFKCFGRNTVFPCSHYSKLVNTQDIQSITSKMSELEKILVFFECESLLY